MDVLLHLVLTLLALPAALLLWGEPAFLVIAALICAPTGMLWAMARGYPPTAVVGRALHWISAPAAGGVILFALGVGMGAWDGLSGWEIGAVRGATWGAFAAGTRLALTAP